MTQPKRRHSSSRLQQTTSRVGFQPRLHDGRPRCQGLTTKLKQCDNPAGPNGIYCLAWHKNGKFYGAQPPAHRPTAPVPQGVRAAPRPASAPPPRPAPIVRIQQAAQQVPHVLDTISLVQQFADEGWAAATQDYLTEQLGDRGWTALKGKWRTSKCDSLAAAAETCDRFSKKLITASGLDDLKYTEGVGVLVRQFNPLEVHAEQAAALLRATGVTICVVRGTLRECACLKAMIDTYGDVPGLITTALRQAIPTIGAQR